MAVTTTATMAELADLLDVSRQQVWAWHERRARTGFPDHDGVITRYGREHRVWSTECVLEWRSTYRPNLGGRRPVQRVA